MGEVKKEGGSFQENIFPDLNAAIDSAFRRLRQTVSKAVKKNSWFSLRPGVREGVGQTGALFLEMDLRILDQLEIQYPSLSCLSCRKKLVMVPVDFGMIRIGYCDGFSYVNGLRSDKKCPACQSWNLVELNGNIWTVEKE